MDKLTLAIAIVGALTGVSSLAWQIIEFRLTGARAKVELFGAWVGPGGALTFAAEDFAAQPVPNPMIDTRTLGVRVRSGRVGVKVMSVYINLGHGMYIHVGQDFPHPPLPHRMEAHDAEQWFMHYDYVESACQAVKSDEQRRTLAIRAAANLAAGQTVESKGYRPQELGIDPEAGRP